MKSSVLNARYPFRITRGTSPKVRSGLCQARQAEMRFVRWTKKEGRTRADSIMASFVGTITPFESKMAVEVKSDMS